jgi:hypothetical protein
MARAANNEKLDASVVFIVGSSLAAPVPKPRGHPLDPKYTIKRI